MFCRVRILYVKEWNRIVALAPMIFFQQLFCESFVWAIENFVNAMIVVG